MKRPHYDELTFTWKKNIAEKLFQHKIQKDLILNFVQFSLRFTGSENNTFTFRKNTETILIGNLYHKNQITGTFVVNFSG